MGMLYSVPVKAVLAMERNAPSWADLFAVLAAVKRERVAGGKIL